MMPEGSISAGILVCKMAQEFEDYYQILGLSSDSTEEAVKERFRLLSKKYHPDINPNSSVEYYRIIEAYKILSDQKSRAIYDRKRLSLLKIQMENQLSRLIRLGPERVEYSIKLNEILSQGIQFNQTFDRDRFINHYGFDMIVYVHPLEVHLGAVVTIDIPVKSICPVCYGKKLDCYRCDGKGNVRTIEKAQFKIPATVQDDDILEIRSEDIINNNQTFIRVKKILIKIVFF